MDMIRKLADAFKAIPSISCMVLAGSRTCAITDQYSDYDIYVYSNTPVPRPQREQAIRQLSDEYTVGNSFFEEGDEFFFPEDGRRMAVDIMYRDFGWTDNEVQSVWIRHEARLGYTTCFMHNIGTSQILFDKDGRFTAVQQTVLGPYPEQLRTNIIEKNHIMLRGDLEAPYLTQIELAVARHDLVSMNHRTAAMLASYFDIIFAFNRQLHPGEKKLMAYAQLLCPSLPRDFETDVHAVLSNTASEAHLVDAVTTLLDHLDELLATEAR